MNIKTLLSHFMKSKKVEISELRAVIEQSGNGHLPLSCRVELLQSIGNVEIVNKVFAECCKKVYPLWGNEIEDTLLRKLLCSADEYLYHGKGKADALVEEANRLRNYVEGQSCTENMAGWAVISLCYSIADHAAAMLDIDEYEGEDDGAFEYEVWNTDFFASMAFAGGNPFVDEGDAGKRREFWNWYLDTVETLCRKSDAPLIRIDAPKKKEVEQNTIPQRTQTYQTPAILSKIQEVINNTLELNIEQCNAEWDKIVLLGCCMSTGINLEGYKTKGNQKYSTKVSLQSHYILDDVKKEMYNQAKVEGAWFYCIIELNPDLTYSIRFVYDDKSQIPQDHLVDSDDFVAEFKKYPRAKEYTPLWWQEILGKKAKYLKNTIIVEQLAIPQRTQTYQTPDILLKIQQIIEKSTKVFNDYCTGNWDRIVVEAHCIDDVRTEGYFICNNIVSKMPVSLSTADLLSEIKNEMYKQASIEGAWLMCKIVFDTQKKFIIEFNYDNKASLPNDVFDNPERLEMAFKKSPRGKDYTPVWWQEILGKKAKYLKNTIIVEQLTIPQRTQTYQTPAIQEKIRQVIENSMKVFNKYCTGNWSKIIVEAHCIGDVRTKGYFIQGNSITEMPVSLAASDLLSEIKDDMYKQASNEGSWLICKIEFDTQKKFIIEFNYDNKSSLPNDVFDNPERLETEFEDYPRTKEYTPVWWQGILGKKAKYLE